MYNAYIPGAGPYEKIPEDRPPGSGSSFLGGLGASLGSLGSLGGKGALSGLLGKLGLGKMDTGDILLLLILFLLWKEGDQFDLILLLALAFLFLREDGSGALMQDGAVGQGEGDPGL